MSTGQRHRHRPEWWSAALPDRGSTARLRDVPSRPAATSSLGRVQVDGPMIHRRYLAVVMLALVIPGLWVWWARFRPVSDGTLILPSAGEPLTITGVYDRASALRPGDIVLTVDGHTVQDWVGNQVHAPHARHRRDLVSYQIRRGGVDEQIAVRLGRYPLLGAFRDDGPLFALAIIVFAVVSAVFLARPRDPTARAMFVFSAALPWIITTNPMGLQVIDLTGGAGVAGYVGGDAAACVLWGALLHFGVAFGEPLTAHPRRRWRTVGCYVVPFLLYGLFLTVTLPGTRDPLTRLVRLIEISAPAARVVPVLGVVLLVRSYRRNRDAAVRLRLRWIAGTFGVGWIFYLALGQIPQGLYGHPLLGYQWLLLVFTPTPFAVAAAILRYRLFDIEVILSRSLIIGGLTAVIVGSYAAVLLLLPAFVDTPDPLVTLLIGGAITAATFAVRQRVTRRVTALVYGQRSDPHAVIAQLSRLDIGPEADRALTDVVRTLAQALRLPYVRLELWGPDGLVESAAQFGTPTAPPTLMPIRRGTDELGRLELDAGPGREQFGPADRRLLEYLGRHLGDAGHTVLLARALQRSRERLVMAREEERRRLRRDLHDGVGPALAAQAMQLELAADLVDRDPRAARSLLGQLGSASHDLIADIRRIVDDLRPPSLDQLGLVSAIREHTRGFDGITGSDHPDGFWVDVEAEGDLSDLPAAIEVAAFRIILEAVSNAARYSRGRHCTVWLRRGLQLDLEISDDGTGLHPDIRGSGVGLESMRGRAAELGGTCTVQSNQDGPGTIVRVRLPLPAPERLP